MACNFANVCVGIRTVSSKGLYGMTITGYRDLVIDSSEGMPNHRTEQECFRHFITISIKGNGPGMAFTYYGSHADFKEGIKVLDENDTLYAAMALMESALAGTYDYHGYVDNYYEGEYSAASYDTWEKARRTHHSFMNLGIDMISQKWVDYLNELREVVDG